MYFLKSERELIIQEIARLGRLLDCSISYKEKVEDKKEWIYSITKEKFDENDEKIIKENGLVLLLEVKESK